ncbi:hypothetical protein pipiens_010639 [Culex pipiens pipiens]|uniref:Gustatory receptor n=1 Tax=Culex pipiens pipiens TaxID=38569 RepID=A0ABD1DA08_CULPP
MFNSMLLFYEATMALFRMYCMFTDVYVNDLLKHIKSPEQVRVLSKAHMDLLPLMQLFTKCFAMPVLYCIMMLFFEGTLQLFQLYVLIDSSDGDYSLMDIFYYVMWYVPFAVKLIVTMHQAASTSNQLKLLTNFHGKTTQLMSLVTNAFSLPILFYVLLTFFEGTLQMFQLYFMLLDGYGSMTPSEIAADIICYFLWLGPLMVKLVVTMQLATRASEVVSGLLLSDCDLQ